MVRTIPMVLIAWPRYLKNIKAKLQTSIDRATEIKKAREQKVTASGGNQIKAIFLFTKSKASSVGITSMRAKNAA